MAFLSPLVVSRPFLTTYTNGYTKERHVHMNNIVVSAIKAIRGRILHRLSISDKLNKELYKHTEAILEPDPEWQRGYRAGLATAVNELDIAMKMAARPTDKNPDKKGRT